MRYFTRFTFLRARDPAVNRAFESVRDVMVGRVLLLLAVLSVLPLALSLARARDIGLQPVMVISVLLVAALWAVLLARTALSPLTIARLLLCFFFLLSVSGYLNLGLSGGGTVFQVVFVLLTTLFFDVQAGIAAFVLSSAVVGFLGVLAVTHHLRFTIDFNTYPTLYSSWLTNLAAIATVVVCALVAGSTLYGALADALSSAELRAAALRRANRALAAITACNQEITRAGSEQELLDRVCQAIAEHGGYVVAWVGYRAGGDPPRIRPQSVYGELAKVLMPEITAPDGGIDMQCPGTIAMRTGRICSIGRLAHESGFEPWRSMALKAGIRSALAAPLTINSQEVIGAVTILSAEADAFGPEEQRLLERLADDLSYGIATRRARVERERAVSALRLSEDRFRAIFEQADVGIGQVAPDGHWLVVNDCLCRMLGYSREELFALRITDSMQPEDMWRDQTDPLPAEQGTLSSLSLEPRFPRKGGSLLEEQGEYTSLPLEQRFLRKDASLLWAAVSVATVRNGDGSELYSIAVIQDITARKEAEQKLRHLALHDPLTGLPNRLLLLDRAAQALLLAERQRDSVALMLLDLDRFKEVNDTFGHPTGDALLWHVAQRLRATVRAVDMVVRLGGDEFALLLPGTGQAGAIAVAESLQTALGDFFAINDTTLRASASIGIAVFPEHGANGDVLLQHADVAMYEAKRARESYAVYAPERDAHSPDRMALMEDLRTAVAQDLLTLYYQPIVESRTGNVLAVEALVRWQHPERGLLLPDVFIPLLERMGLYGALTRWVLREALRQQQLWREAGLDLTLNLNFSALDFHDPALVADITVLVSGQEGSVVNLCIELTESALIADMAQTWATLSVLSAMGARIAIDDYGTGYSSLLRLARLPVDELKIDRSFIQRMAHDSTDATIVSSTLAMAHRLGLRVVAEGVEDAATLQQLAQMGCDAVQGFYLSRPLSLAALENWLSERRPLAWQFGETGHP